jgi:hypothetical protein
MSSEADQAAVDKRVADEASAAAASSNWPTGGYYMLIPLLPISMCIVLAIYVDVSTICLVLHSYMIKYQYIHVMLMFYSWINIIEKLPRFLTYSNIYAYYKIIYIFMFALIYGDFPLILFYWFINPYFEYFKVSGTFQKSNGARIYLVSIFFPEKQHENKKLMRGPTRPKRDQVARAQHLVVPPMLDCTSSVQCCLS